MRPMPTLSHALAVISPSGFGGRAAWEVARGGSWNNKHDNARASSRNNNHPGNRNNNLGCRLVCVSHIVRSRTLALKPAGASIVPPAMPVVTSTRAEGREPGCTSGARR